MSGTSSATNLEGMDLLQFLQIVVAVLGVVIVGLSAVVPDLLEFGGGTSA